MSNFSTGTKSERYYDKAEEVESLANQPIHTEEEEEELRSIAERLLTLSEKAEKS